MAKKKVIAKKKLKPVKKKAAKKHPAKKKRVSKYHEKFVINGTFEELLKATFSPPLIKK